MSSVTPAPPAIHQTEECWASIDGHRMRYLRAGSGPSLLLIHGLLGYSFSWRFTIPALADNWTIYAPDLLGTGFSDRPAKLDCSVRATAERVLRFVDEVGLDSTDLVGTSHGGGVAAMMAALAPGRIRKLVLVAPVNPWSAHGKLVSRLLSTRFSQLAVPAIANAFEFTARVWLARMYGDPRKIPPGTLEGYRAPFAIDGMWQYGLGTMGCWNKDLRELEWAYSRIMQPTLLVWGTNDGAVYPSSSKEVQSRNPQCEGTVMFEGVGHLPYEECPEEFNEELRHFLTKS
jgi:pimeloyl-ACP methyl ester carboxylesterase